VCVCVCVCVCVRARARLCVLCTSGVLASLTHNRFVVHVTVCCMAILCHEKVLQGRRCAYNALFYSRFY
jgi:hypothetical protein